MRRFCSALVILLLVLMSAAWADGLPEISAEYVGSGMTRLVLTNAGSDFLIYVNENSEPMEFSVPGKTNHSFAISGISPGDTVRLVCDNGEAAIIVPEPPEPSVPEEECEHGKWDYGTCMLCGMECQHPAWDEGICEMCNTNCEHVPHETGPCPVCGENCFEWHSYVGNTCYKCGRLCEHGDPIERFWVDGVCRQCGAACEHEWKDGVCNECSIECPHDGEWLDEYCASCGEMCEHQYRNGTCMICLTNLELSLTVTYLGYGQASCEVYGALKIFELYVNDVLVGTYTEDVYVDNPYTKQVYVSARPGDTIRVISTNGEEKVTISYPEGYVPSPTATPLPTTAPTAKPPLTGDLVLTVINLGDGTVRCEIAGTGGFAELYINGQYDAMSETDAWQYVTAAMPGDVIKVSSFNGECSVVVPPLANTPSEPTIDPFPVLQLTVSYIGNGMTQCMVENTGGFFEIYVNGAIVAVYTHDSWSGTIPAAPGDVVKVVAGINEYEVTISASPNTPSEPSLSPAPTVKPTIAPTVSPTIAPPTGSLSLTVTYLGYGQTRCEAANTGGHSVLCLNGRYLQTRKGENWQIVLSAVPGDVIRVSALTGDISAVVQYSLSTPSEPSLSPTQTPTPIVTPSEPACPHMAPEIRNGLDEFGVYEGVDLPDGYTHYKAPTCTANGYQSYFCIWCGREVRAEVIPALEHKNTDGQDQYRSTGKYVPAMCSENQKRIYACRICGETKTVDMRNDTKLGHRYDPDGAHIIVREATCTQTGQIVHICANPLYAVENGRAVIEGYCSERINETTEALGHDFAHEKDSDTGIAIGKCARCGTTTLPTGPEPKYGVFVSGKKGYIQLSNKTDIAYKDMYVRYSVGYDASGTHFAVVTTVKVAWNDGQRGQTGTFTLPNIQSGGLFTGASCIVTTDANADELSLNQAAAQSLGMLIQ